MKTLQTAASAGLAVALIGTAAIAETTLSPGYYEAATRLPGETKARITHDCLTPEEARESTVERRIGQAAVGQCAYGPRKISGGKFAVAGTCTNDDGSKTSFKVTGGYSATSMTMNLASSTNLNGRLVPMNLAVSLRRIAAACPAGAR